MSSLFVDRRDVHLELEAGAIVFREGEKRIGTVPLAPLTRVILRGSVTLEASLLGQLGERGIGVIILSGKQGKASLMLGRPHHDASRRVEQVRCSLDPEFCLNFARQVINIKIERQAHWFDQMAIKNAHSRHELLLAKNKLLEHLEKLRSAESLETLRGVEGSAAHIYFEGLGAVVPASLQFMGRNRRPPRDPFNVLLSLTYTMALAEVALALYNAGFDPYVGFYHQLDFARESLACDLIETVRPLADMFCLEIVSHQTLTKDHFSQSSTGCILGKAGRALYYAAYEENIGSVRHSIKESVEMLQQVIKPECEIVAASDSKAYSKSEDNDSEEI